MKNNIKKILFVAAIITLFAPKAFASYEDTYIQPDETTKTPSDRYYFNKTKTLGDLGSVEITLPDSNNVYGMQNNGYTIIKNHTDTPQNNVVYYNIYNGNTDGGAITNINPLDSINADFIHVRVGNYEGGAVYNTGIIGQITADFIGCISGKEGGALYNYGTINNITGNFYHNMSDSDARDVRGGAIYNSGEIYHITADFIDNHARIIAYNHNSYGGAIYNDGSGSAPGIMTIEAINKDIMFINNKVESSNMHEGGAIYNNEGTINLNASDGHKINFETTSDSIHNENGTININRNGETGQVNIKAEVRNGNGVVNIGSGTIYIEEYLDNGDSISPNNILNLADGNVCNLTINHIDSAGKLFLDWNDNIDIKNVTVGNMKIEEVNFISQPEVGDSKTISGTREDVNPIYAFIDDKKYTIGRTNNIITVQTEDNTDGLKTFFENPQRFYSMTKDNEVAGDLNSITGGNEKSIFGGGHTIKGNNNAPFFVGRTTKQTLSINDANIQGFGTTNEAPATITLDKESTLNINAINSDVILGDNAEGSSNLSLKLKDGNNTVNLNASADKTLTIKHDIVSDNNTNTMYLKGAGNIVLDEAINLATIRNYTNTVRNKFDSDVTWELYDGTLKYTNDAYLNDNPNIINFFGGALDIANGAVNNIKLNTLKVSSPSKIAVDVDAATGKMDTLSASYMYDIRAKLNVSKFNILNPVKGNFSSNFISDELGNYEKMRGHITTEVEQVLTPIYKYNVKYTEDETARVGKFDFTIAKGSKSEYQRFNPAILSSSVAAQVGYLNQLQSYNYGFKFMDDYMNMPKLARFAINNRNKYAISEGTPKYYSSTTKSGWFEPYTTFENIALKNGPKVDTITYGSYFGGDSEIRRLKRGWNSVYSAYVGYNGAHESFEGVKLNQNGGTLGFSGTFFKDNFFTSLVASVGSSVSESNTIYGTDHSTLLSAGTALKTGYNFEFKKGKHILQPSLLTSYTMAKVFDYTNAAGVRITSDPLHAITIQPQLKYILNLKNGWQPYIFAGMTYNIMDKTNFKAQDVTLPQMSVKPYVHYGVGVQKKFGERFTGFMQTIIRNGGRSGVGLSFGFKWELGKKPSGL